MFLESAETLPHHGAVRFVASLALAVAVSASLFVGSGFVSPLPGECWLVFDFYFAENLCRLVARQELGRLVRVHGRRALLPDRSFAQRHQASL